jgi:hypothetical protein
MSGGELGQSVGAVSAPTFRQTRAAAVHVADRIAAEHPHELDELMPKLAGKQLARQPAIAAGVLELLDALGLAAATELSRAEATARNFADTDAAGYIDRTGLEQQ